MRQLRKETGENAIGHRVTLRDIADKMGVSHVTVSKALRNLSGVSETMKLRIQQKAAEMGYIPDPLLASLSRYRKSSKIQPIQSEIAWINPLEDPQKIRQHKEFSLYWEGAYENARQLGFHLQEYKTKEIPLNRLKAILKARNIQGVLLPPLDVQAEGFNRFDWSGLSVVRFGQSDADPRTHFVGSAQVANTMCAFDQAQQLGYKRIGFVCEYWPARLFAAGYAWARRSLPEKKQLPLLVLSISDNFETQQASLKEWLQANKPDAILTDNSEIMRMLTNLGYEIPKDIGLATTSIHDTAINAGIDQRPYEIGRAAVRMLISLISERNFGIPECRSETLIEGKWVNGTMLPKLNG